MTDARWSRIEQLFHETLAQPVEARAAFLERAAAGDADLRSEVGSLLAANAEEPGFLERTALEAAASTLAPVMPDLKPPAVHGYRIIRELGEGGMGVVYLAEQESPLRRLVALKFIRPGMDTRHVLARFETERQALARMDHPNIAAVFDAGSTLDGRPYFVMEYVDGLPITEYCDRIGASIRTRLELFTQVCAGVQHAHQKGVIHRDIKPSNVLVAEQDRRALPKVIDFGMAKAVRENDDSAVTVTAPGMQFGTLEYLSPEQAAFSNDIDASTDVYSLGVLLYELLAGVVPFARRPQDNSNLDSLLTAIKEFDPPRPSSRITPRQTSPSARELRRDLDWIVLKALEKQRERRYATAAAFAEDVDRYLLNQPVQARPQSAAYRIGKFTRRHRGVVAASTAVLLSLMAGFLTTAAMYVRSEERRIEALQSGHAATIAAADAEIRAYQPLIARARLLDVPEELRHWEWHHLFLKTDPSIKRFKSSALCDLGAPPPGTAAPDNAVVVSATGQQLFLSRCSTVDMWNLSTGLQKTAVFPEQVLAVTRQGDVVTSLVSGPAPNRTWTLKVSPLTGGADFELGSFSLQPICTAFNPDQSLIAVGLAPPDSRVSSQAGGRFEIWNLRTRRRTVGGIPFTPLTFIGPWQTSSCAVAFSPDSRLLATSDERVTIWNATTGVASHAFHGPLMNFHQPIAFSPNSKSLAIGRYDGTVDVLDVMTGQVARHFERAGAANIAFAPAKNAILAIAFSRDGQNLISGAAMGVAIWDVTTGGLSHTFNGHPAAVNSVDMSVDGQLVTGDASGSVRMWPRTTSGAVTVRRTSVVTGSTAVASADGSTTVVADPFGRLEAWRVGSPSPTVLRPRSRSFTPRLQQLFLTSNGRELLVSEESPTGRVVTYDTQSGATGQVELNANLEPGCAESGAAGSTRPVYPLAVSLDGRYLAHAQSNCVVVRDRASSKVLAVFHEVPTSLVFRPDNSLLMSSAPWTSSGRGAITIRVWDWSARRTVAQLALPATASGAQLYWAASSADGRRIAVFGGTPTTLTVWDEHLRRVISNLAVPNGTWSVALNADGSRLATTKGDEIVRVWDVDRGSVSLLLTDNDDHRRVTFATDGRIIAGRSQGGFTIWDSQLPKCPDCPVKRD